MSPKLRLQKYIAECGIASRRKAEELILAGKVKVNGKVITRLGTKVGPDRDQVMCDGKDITRSANKIYIKLNKPCGYVSSCRKYDDKTILDLVKDVPDRLYPVGRLDIDSEGLMLLTNDGELANRLTHPRYEHEKEYEVNVQLTINNEQLKKLSSGIRIDEKKTLPAKIKRTGPRSFRIVLKEGKKRQIRRMVEAIGNRVVNLKRVRIKNIELGKLPLGSFQYLTKEELKKLIAA